MKKDLIIIYTLGPLIIFLSSITSVTATNVVEPREAYFNGSTYLRYMTPMPIWTHSAISFRSCRGGEILSQRYAKHTLLVTVTPDSVTVALIASKDQRVDARIVSRLLDNKWHTIEFLYQLGNLYLKIDRQSVVIANSTYNSLFLTDQDIRNEAAILIVGNKFSGCLLHGPGLVFNTTSMHAMDVLFGPCPLATGPCTDHDVLIRIPINHCLHEPCMQHGSCFSRPESYECHCTARYAGKNCEIDTGPPCHSQPCQNGGTCNEDNQGNFHCYCSNGFNGKFCETEVIIHPLCEKNPCLNNGTCKVPQNNNIFECECLDGFTGPRCETDWNDCESQPCLNNGHCIDNIGSFTCECNTTGYSGTICQNNIDECNIIGPCLNGGTCFDTYGSYTCECLIGFGGINCEQIINECQSQPCQQGGTCVDNKGNFECICAQGYSGVYCEIHPPCPQCPFDSECIDGRCVCKPGTTGLVGHCVTAKSAKTNACSTICLNGATCTGNASNITCICPTGFTGFRCESSMVQPSFSPPSFTTDDCTSSSCMNGGTCNTNTTECICPSGFEGLRCENIDLCNALNCIEPMTCIGGQCLCPENINCNGPCAVNPCVNGGTCHAQGNEFLCQCPNGFNGTNCSDDIDECLQQEDICGHGICVNRPGGFKCYCEPGFTGALCDMDVDECLSRPCKNGANCINLVNDFQCVCLPGYEAKDCGTDIDECAGNPCSQGSTCLDLVANFSCLCIPGMTGRLCEIDIDDCESQPCQHNGHCIDQLGGFKCDCMGTGYSGGFCEINIDECLSSPCENGAECTDKINDYLCECYQGYTGKNCEIDIDECESNPCQFGGKCLQRSNFTIYNMPASTKYTLPIVFSQKFGYENASGYECICVQGIVGRNCEININECDSNPCTKNGNCVDGIGTYFCECEPGFNGVHCEIDIDECEIYKPCINGTCIDGRDNYICDCDYLWGGKNCSVSLTGCSDSPCLNGGTCIPYLENETQHKFNCSCRNGFQGATCEKITTMSLVASSLLTVNTTRDEGYEIHLRFKTTLPNGILAFGNGITYSYILELVKGRLNLHSSLLNKWEGVFIGSGLNDSKWQKVFVAINSSHLVLSANEEQTIYPINSYEGTNASHTSFPVTYLGGTIPNLRSYLRHLPHAPSSFVGCMEDVVINGQWIFPFESNMYTTLVKVETGCPRTPQCDPNPCNSNGQCSDLWHTFSCTCQRPHLGPTCKYNITAATFANENTTHSDVIVKVSDIGRRIIRSILDISMFIRTRQPTGQVFYLGSDPRKMQISGNNERGDSYVSAKLHGGELLVQIQINGTPEAYTVGGNKLDNGNIHLIQVVRNLTLVQVKLNGTEYFRKTLSSTGQLNAQVLYLGGPTSSDDSDVILTKEEEDKMYFKGIIQDVQVSNGSHAMLVQLFPLNEQALILPPPLGDVTIDATSVLKGEVSDDLCRRMPCAHGASCKNTWNDFVCICPRGYKGRYCQDIQFCELHICPGDSVCQNLDDGFECITNVTFQGKQNLPLVFSLNQYEQTPLENIVGTQNQKNSIEITYKTKFGGTLLYVNEDDMFFEIAIDNSEVLIQWRFSSEAPEIIKFSSELAEFNWTTIYIHIEDGKLEAGWKGWETLLEPLPMATAPMDQNAFLHLFSGKFFIFLGGIPYVESNAVTTAPTTDKYFKGCLGETRVNNWLLPFFPHSEIYSDNFTPRPHFRLNSTKPSEGCTVCFQQDCKNGGICTNPPDEYACSCPPGYALDDCSENINECLTAQCTNNSTCIDGIASYKCVCLPGYNGRLCETEINECLSEPCHNNGICTDLIAEFSCNCTEDYAGSQCDVLRLVTCENLPCKNGSTCIDGYNSTTGNNYTCSCQNGFESALCDIPFCSIKSCQNGGYCHINDQPICQCRHGFTGKYCEIEINECESQPCQNGGICNDIVAGFYCNCTNTGYEGTACEIDIDECATGQIFCGIKALCINTKGSFRCKCHQGMCGSNCDTPDPCINNPNICKNEGICIDMCKDASDYICNCTEGFIGKNCTEIASFKDDDTSPANIAIIVIPIVIGLLALGGALLAAFLIMARNKRATRGTYSPSAQEYCNPRLEMDNVLKPPPEERLI